MGEGTMSGEQGIKRHLDSNVGSSNCKKSLHMLPRGYCCLGPEPCSALRDPMDYTPPGSSVLGISQARTLEWVAIPSSRGSPWSRDWAHVSCIADRFFTTASPGKTCPKGVKWFSSVIQSCPTLCDPVDYRTPGFSVDHKLPELTQTHVHKICHAIQPPHSLSSPAPPAFNLSQQQGLFKWVISSNQVAFGVSASASVFAMNIQDWYHLGWIGWISLQSRGLSRVFSNTTFKSINASALSFHYSPTVTSIYDYYKNHNFD